MSTALATKMATLGSYLSARQDKLANILTDGLDPVRMVALVLAQASKNPDLLECTPESVYLSLHQGAQLGLEICTPLGFGHLIAYKNKQGRKECTFQPGYQGLLQLARNSEQVSNIYAMEVYPGDRISFAFGMTPSLTHVPNMDHDDYGEEGKETHFYAVGKVKEGDAQFVIWTRKRLEKHRNRYSKSWRNSGKNSIWGKNFREMALKTVLIQLCKMLPKSSKMALAIQRDYEADAEVIKDAIGHVVEDAAPASKNDQLKEDIKKQKAKTAAKVEKPKPEPPKEEVNQELEELGGKAPAKEKSNVNVPAPKEGPPNDMTLFIEDHASNVDMKSIEDLKANAKAIWGNLNKQQRLVILTELNLDSNKHLSIFLSDKEAFKKFFYQALEAVKW